MTFTKEELINYIDLHFMGKQIVAATPIKSSDVDLIDTAFYFGSINNLMDCLVFIQNKQ